MVPILPSASRKTHLRTEPSCLAVSVRRRCCWYGLAASFSRSELTALTIMVRWRPDSWLATRSDVRGIMLVSTCGQERLFGPPPLIRCHVGWLSYGTTAY